MRCGCGCGFAALFSSLERPMDAGSGDAEGAAAIPEIRLYHSPNLREGQND